MFCKRCGQKLVETVGLGWWNVKTGEYAKKIRYQCPRAHWWNTHTKFWRIVDGNGKVIADSRVPVAYVKVEDGW